MSALTTPDWTRLSRAERIRIMRPAVLAGWTRAEIAMLFVNATAAAVTGYVERHGAAIRSGVVAAPKRRPRRGAPWHPARDPMPAGVGR